MIRLYDTLTARKRRLRLRRSGEVSMYVCGPTVYDHPHLGHARSVLTYDVLRRYLEWRGLEVRHVANITDIDDKIIAKARQESRSEAEVAAEWESVYIAQMNALQVLAPHERPRATEWVDEMIQHVQKLQAVGKAYVTDSGVYLRVREVDGYGDLVHRSLDDLRAAAGSRVEVDAAKEDPLDFALWKAAKPGEPVWESPWGPGRPGWHIECTAMTLGILGDGFDLHGGGDDLVFPHHTNERAQALAAGHVFARHWMHNAMLNVDGAKMAKSLGNFRTMVDLLNEHPHNGRALRLLTLQTHYRKTMEVNAELIAAARAAVNRLDAMTRRAAAAGISISPDRHARAAKVVGGSASAHRAAAHSLSTTTEGVGGVDGGVGGSVGVDGGVGGSVGVRPGRGEATTVEGGPAASAVEAFKACMDDDMGTPEALAVIFETLRHANAALDAHSEEASALVSTVVELAGVLGIVLEPAQQANSAARSLQSTHADDEKINGLVERRRKARQSKDWATADALRNQLAAMGIAVEDTADGSTWHRL